MDKPIFMPTMGILKREGFTHKAEGTSPNRNKWSGFINSESELRATRLFAKWEHGGTIQIAHKEAGEMEWKFRGFGYFDDEPHFLRLLANPQIISEPKDAGTGDAIVKAAETV